MCMAREGGVAERGRAAGAGLCAANRATRGVSRSTTRNVSELDATAQVGTHRTLQLEQLEICLGNVVLQTGDHALRHFAVQAYVRGELVLADGIAADGFELVVEAVDVCFKGCYVDRPSVLRPDRRQL